MTRLQGGVAVLAQDTGGGCEHSRFIIDHEDGRSGPIRRALEVSSRRKISEGTVPNGRAFVAAKSEVDVYGLLAPAR